MIWTGTPKIRKKKFMEMADFPTPTYIHNYQSVVNAYGYWPSFHDAPLLSFAVKDIILEQFDIPNTLFEMTFSAPSDFERAGRFRVGLQSVMGGDCTLTFSAEAGDVVSVDPRANWPSRESDTSASS